MGWPGGIVISHSVHVEEQTTVGAPGHILKKKNNNLFIVLSFYPKN